MLALVGTVMSRSPSGNVLLRGGDKVLGTHRLHRSGRCRAIGHDPRLGMTDATLRIERAGPVARIVLSRPERHNAQNPQMWRELMAAGAALAVDEEVRAVVVAGDGPSFSSGIDLAEREPGGFLRRVAEAADDTALAMIGEAQAAIGWPARAPFPVIAAVRGVRRDRGGHPARAGLRHPDRRRRRPPGRRRGPTGHGARPGRDGLCSWAADRQRQPRRARASR
jgi:Enoyl-CoA hydratase/isomerase